MMPTPLADLRLAWRRLARTPGQTATTIAVLGLGLGACLVVWLWLDHLVLRPIPGIPDGGRIRVVWATSRDGAPMALSTPDVRDLVRELSGPEAPMRFTATEMVGVGVSDGVVAEPAYAGLVSGDFFDVMGVAPARGRFFHADEDATVDARPVAVLSDRFWRRRFAADPAIVGRSIRVNSRDFTVVGVAPPGFRGSEPGLTLDLWVPLAMQVAVFPGGDLSHERGNRWLRGLARLAPGASDTEAAERVAAFGQRLEQEHPGTNRDILWRFGRLDQAPWGASQFLAPVLGVLGAMVGLVLAVACANVASVLLVRGLARRKELAVRRALGASRARLAAELAAECVLLAAAGAAAGLLVAQAGKGALLALLPALAVPVDPSMPLDPRTAAVATALALVTALLFGVAPALQGSRVPIEAALRDESAGGGGRGRGRLRALFVGAQVAFAAVLLLAGALFVRSAREGAKLDPGFRARQLLFGSIDLFAAGYDRARALPLLAELERRLEALPGVESAAFARRLVLDLGGSSSTFLEIDGYAPAPDEQILVRFNLATPGYFDTLDAPLLAGRDFAASDDADAPNVAIVSRAMAERYWPGREPVGATFRTGGEVYGVIGVAPDIAVKDDDLAGARGPYFYLPLAQSYRSTLALHVRTAGDPLAAAAAVRATVAEAAPDLPLAAVKSLDQHFGVALFRQRLAASLLAASGGVALALAALGVWAVVAHGLAQRRRELAVRAALGASPGALARLAASQAARIAAAGAGAGLAGGLAVARLLRSQLVAVTPADPLALGAVLVALVTVAALASWLPARRAAAADPSHALRAE